MPVASSAILAATIASAAIAAAGAIQQGRAANNQAKYQSAVQMQQAQREREIAGLNATDFRRRQDQAAGQWRAAQGGSGVEMGTGSPLLSTEDFAGETELAALRIRAGGEDSATRLEQSANLTRMAGKSAQTGSYFKAGSLLVGGAGKAYGQYKAGSGGSSWDSYSSYGKYGTSGGGFA